MTEKVTKTNNKQKIKNIIFDFDGTIANTLEFATTEIYHQFQKHKIQIPRKEIKRIILEESFISLVKKFEISKIRLIYTIWRIQKNINKQIEKIKPFPYIKETIKTLSINHNIYILTGNSKSNVTKFLKNNHLENEIKNIKARTSAFDKSNQIEKFLKKHNLNKSETIYIADELSDIKACQKIKLKIITVTYGLNSEKLLQTQNPKYIINSPEKIIKVINSFEEK